MFQAEEKQKLKGESMADLFFRIAHRPGGLRGLLKGWGESKEIMSEFRGWDHDGPEKTSLAFGRTLVFNLSEMVC